MAPKYPDDEVPTVGQLAASEPRWVFAYCVRPGCGHSRAIPLVPFIIRWGAGASSNRLRRELICSKCGLKGVQIVTASPDGSHGPMPFPAESAIRAELDEAEDAGEADQIER